MAEVKNGKVVKGLVQALGPSSSEDFGRYYKYITIAKDDGAVARVEHVTVPSMVNDFLNTGVKGELFFHVHGKLHTLLAMDTGNRKVFDRSDAWSVFFYYIKKHCFSLLFTAFFGGVWWLGHHDKMSGLALIGQVLTFFGLFGIYYTRVGARYLLPHKAEQLVRKLGFS